jgi:hypothetical protein
VSVWLAEIRTFRMALVFPWLPATLSLLAALLLLWEGWICIWLWLPLVLLLSALGGAVVWAVRRVGSPGKARSAVACVAALPLAASPLEQQLALPSQIRHVETEIRIEAPAERVWAAIVEVPAIAEREHEFAWSHAIGFPRPIAALADGEGVGSLRTATFERGVVFRERVHTWQPGVALAFSIDPESIPARGLDEHVTVGGKYFDVLSGSYRIERSQDGAVVLHLSSEHRLSTRFNAYASWWTDFIMRDTQRYILRIIRDRCEAAAE